MLDPVGSAPLGGAVEGAAGADNVIGIVVWALGWGTGWAMGSVSQLTHPPIEVVKSVTPTRIDAMMSTL
jgi:hypothetical protein